VRAGAPCTRCRFFLRFIENQIACGSKHVRCAGRQGLLAGDSAYQSEERSEAEVRFQNRQLNILIGNSNHQVDDFVGGVTFQNPLINTLCEISFHRFWAPMHIAGLGYVFERWGGSHIR
jgi:hypothetical protein